MKQATEREQLQRLLFGIQRLLTQCRDTTPTEIELSALAARQLAIGRTGPVSKPSRRHLFPLRWPHLHRHRIEPGIARTIRKQLQSDGMAGGFVLDQDDTVAQFGADLVGTRGLPKDRQQFHFRFVIDFYLRHTFSPSLMASVRYAVTR